MFPGHKPDTKTLQIYEIYVGRRHKPKKSNFLIRMHELKLIDIEEEIGVGVISRFLPPRACLNPPRTCGVRESIAAAQNPQTGSSSSSGAVTRRRTATHHTPISRPRNRQRENSPEGNENRIGSIMAMMMMSQASDRDERREEREERRQ